MNIQAILSALPTPLSSTAQSGGQPGQFALALDRAAQNSSAGNGELPLALDAALTQGLPSSVADQKALLQALHAAVHTSDGSLELAEPDAQLSEIMARLALIAGQDEAALPLDATTLEARLAEHAAAVDLAPGAADSSQSTEPLEAQAALLAAAISTEARQAGAAMAGSATSDRGPLTATLNQAAANPLAPQANAERGLAVAADTSRAADTAIKPEVMLSRATAAPQPPAGELRQISADAARGGFVPEATPLAPTTTGNSGPANSATAAALPSQASLSTPVQSQAWPNQLGQQLVQFARQGGEQRIEMRLNPAELGPLSVTLKMSEQGAQAQFLSAHAPVRQVLEQAIPQLREALAEQGITLGETSVGEQQRQDAQAFAGNQGQGNRHAATQADAEDDGTLAADEALASSPGTSLPLDGRVSLYA